MSASENINRKIYDLIVARNFHPEMRDLNGQSVTDPSQAEMFNFEFVSQSGKDYGTVVLFLGDDNSLQVFYADNIGRGMEDTDKDEWFQFLQQLSLFAKRNRLSFDLRNINKLRYSMQGQAALKEGLFEAWSGKKNVSYNAKPDGVRLMIKHNKDIAEGEQRFRHISSLFVETDEGERFKLPFKSLAGGKAMCEHVRNGGRPYDPRGTHITDLVSEVATLTRFGRANPDAIFENTNLVEQAAQHLHKLKENLRTLSTRRGYSGYFESWSPAAITEQDVMIEEIRNLMTTQDVDSRIEDALPILAKLPGPRVDEGDLFESWANELLKRI